MSGVSLIPTEKIIERLRYENPWWVSRQIPETYSAMSRRLYFDLFYPFVAEKDVRRALVLMGPRRVGKTVLLFHSIQQLIEEEVNPQQIFFVGIDKNQIKLHIQSWNNVHSFTKMLNNLVSPR